MSEHPQSDIDEEVRRFRDSIDQLYAIDPESGSVTAAELAEALASAPTTREASHLLLEWASKYDEALDFRNSVVVSAVAKYGLFIVFSAPDLLLLGKEGHLHRLRAIRMICRRLGIRVKGDLELSIRIRTEDADV